MQEFSLSSKVRIGAYILAVSSILSRFLGVFRDYLFAKIFGVGEGGGLYSLDAYFAAFRIPDFLYTLLIMSALSTAFIPLYTRLKSQNESEASKFASSILNGLFMIFLGLGILCFISAPWLLALIAPGLPNADLPIAVDLTRLMLLSPLFLGISSVLQGIENVEKRFYGMAAAPLVYNGSIILATVFFAKEYGVYALGYGVVIGAILHTLVQLPGALHTSFHYRLSLPVWDESLKEFIRLAIPRVFSVSASQIALLVDTLLASLLSVGALSIYMYSLNLQSFPYGVVAISLSVAVFSTLSQQALSDDKSLFVNTFKSAFNTIFYWAVPAAIGLFLLREPIVIFLLQGGAFDSESTRQTVSVLTILIWAAVPQSFIPLFTRSFFALSETKIPVILSLLSVTVNVFLSIIFTRILDLSLQGLALSTLLSSSLTCCVLLVSLSRFLKRPLTQFLSFRFIFHSLIASALMSVTVIAIQRFSVPSIFMNISLSALFGFLVYRATFRLFRR